MVSLEIAPHVRVHWETPKDHVPGMTFTTDLRVTFPECRSTLTPRALSILSGVAWCSFGTIPFPYACTTFPVGNQRSDCLAPMNIPPKETWTHESSSRLRNHTTMLVENSAHNFWCMGSYVNSGLYACSRDTLHAWVYDTVLRDRKPYH